MVGRCLQCIADAPSGEEEDSSLRYMTRWESRAARTRFSSSMKPFQRVQDNIEPGSTCCASRMTVALSISHKDRGWPAPARGLADTTHASGPISTGHPHSQAAVEPGHGPARSGGPWRVDPEAVHE